MKILYIAAIRLPTEKAHGVQIMKTCEALSDNGAEVELVIPERVNALSGDAFAYYGVRKNFLLTICNMPKFGISAIEFVLGLLWFSEVASARDSFWNADVVYSRDAGVLLQYILLGRRLVYEAHTAPTRISKFVARRAYRVIVISQGLAAAYQSAGVAKAKIILAPDAVDLDLFSNTESQEDSRKRLGLSLDKKIVMYIGRLDGWKGVDTLCEATTLLSDDIQVVMIGGEPDQVRKFHQKFPSVIFLGFRPYTELAQNQAAADVLILPNTALNIDSAKYTSPLKLFTYMTSGKPIVTSDLPSIREIVNEESVFFATPDDPSSLAQSITQALQDPIQAKERAAKALSIVQNHTWKARAETILGGMK